MIGSCHLHFIFLDGETRTRATCFLPRKTRALGDSDNARPSRSILCPHRIEVCFRHGCGWLFGAAQALKELDEPADADGVTTGSTTSRPQAARTSIVLLMVPTVPLWERRREPLVVGPLRLAVQLLMPWVKAVPRERAQVMRVTRRS